MEDSILTSTKKMLHIAEDDTSFDPDVLTHINAAFSTLHDLGVGPTAGFTIEDDGAAWDDFISDEEDLDLIQLNQAKTFIYLSTRLAFDPPATSFVLAAAERQLTELTWRLNARREGEDWVDPDPVVVEEL